MFVALTLAPSLSRLVTLATSPSNVAHMSGVLPSALRGRSTSRSAIVVLPTAVPAHSRATATAAATFPLIRMTSGLAESAGGVAELVELHVRALSHREQYV